jgi:hypothetical protein
MRNFICGFILLLVILASQPVYAIGDVGAFLAGGFLGRSTLFDCLVGFHHYLCCLFATGQFTFNFEKTDVWNGGRGDFSSFDIAPSHFCVLVFVHP